MSLLIRQQQALICERQIAHTLCLRANGPTVSHKSHADGGLLCRQPKTGDYGMQGVHYLTLTQYQTFFSIASNVLGVSGRSMLEAMIAGEKDPVALADLARKNLRKKITHRSPKRHWKKTSIDDVGKTAWTY